MAEDGALPALSSANLTKLQSHRQQVVFGGANPATGHHFLQLQAAVILQDKDRSDALPEVSLYREAILLTQNPLHAVHVPLPELDALPAKLRPQLRELDAHGTNKKNDSRA